MATFTREQIEGPSVVSQVNKPSKSSKSKFTAEEVAPSIVIAQQQQQQQPPAEGPGGFGAFMKGAYETMSPEAGPNAFNVQPKEGFNPPMGLGPSGLTDEQYNASQEQRALPRGGENIADPTNPTERVLHGMGQQAPAVAAGGLFVGPLMGAGVVGGVGAGLVGSAASEILSEMGYGPVPQFAADLTASTLSGSPGKVMANITGSAMSAAEKKSATSAAQVLREMGSRSAETGQKLPLLERTQQRVSAKDVTRAARALRGDIATGTGKGQGDKYVDRVRERIGQAQEQFAGGPKPSLAAVEGEYGAGSMARELRLAKADVQGYGAPALGRKLDVMEGVSAEFPAMRPPGGYTDAVDGLAKATEDSQAEVSRLWGLVDSDAMPMPSTAKMKTKVQALIDSSEAGAKHMPPEAATILAYGDNVTAAELQNLRSEVLTSIRLSKRVNASDAAIRQGGRAKQILKIIDETELASYPPGMSVPLDEARAATAKHKDMFSMRRKGIHALSEYKDPKKALQRLRVSKDGPDEARNLMSALKETDGGIEGLRATVFDDVFGETIGDNTVRAMRNNLRIPANRKIYQEIFEPEQLEVMERYVEKWAMASSGKTGGPAQAMSTGTGYEFLDLRNIVNQGRTLAGAGEQFARWGFKKLTGSSKQELALVKLATQDIDLAKVLLDVKVPEKLPAMKAIWNSAVDASLEVPKSAGRQTPQAFARDSFRE